MQMDDVPLLGSTDHSVKDSELYDEKINKLPEKKR